MKKTGLLVCMLASMIIVAGCTSSNYKCPDGTEYWEDAYKNGQVKTQGCFVEGDEIMEGHRTYYYENGRVDMEGDIENDMFQGLWKYYEEDGSLAMEGTYKDDKEDGVWTYYDEEGEYICSETYMQGELVDQGDCVFDEMEDLDENNIEEVLANAGEESEEEYSESL